MHVLAARAKPPGVPLIWHVRDYVSLRPVMRRLLAWHADRCDLMLAISNSIASDIERVCGERAPTSLMYNVTDPIRFTPEGTVLDLDACASLEPAPPGTVRIGLVATFARWKGHDTFLRALTKLPPELPIRAYLIGGPLYATEGSEYTDDELRSRVTELGLDGKVGLTGFVTERAEAMRALDVVVHASTRPEPFGNVITEAMACGRAVVISGAGGAAEIVNEGEDALAHPPGDCSALADRLAALVRDPETRRRLGAAARRTVERRFSKARLARELPEIYRRVMASASACPATPEAHRQSATTPL
jgi:glycosyltransferase involved in cell wall biosynthesis